MELQNLVKVKVMTLDPYAEPVEVTVASVGGCVSAQQVHKKVCDALGLKESSRAFFSLFEKGDRPTCRYRLTEDIPLEGSELYLGKWCFVGSQEKDLIHVDPVAAHLIFLQAQHDVHTGKFKLSEDEKQKLEECLEPGFTAEDQYLLLCQKQPNYHSLYVPQCTLQKDLVSPTGLLKSNSMVNVSVSKFGVRLVAAGQMAVVFTWFEVSRWMLNRGTSTLTLTWTPEAEAVPSDVPLSTPQADLFLAGVIEMIKILQKSDKSGGSFHAEMISEEEDGTTVWENGLYNPSKAKNVQYSV